MLASKKAKKVMSAICAFALALTATAPFVGKSASLKAAAERTESGGYIFDFRDGSIVATDTKVDNSPEVTVDNLTIGTGYRYNDASHGIELTPGNSIDIKVDGPTRIVVGDCEFNTADTLTVTSADGSYSQTKAVKTGCYHNGISVDFRYEGTEPTTLTLKYNNKAYVSVIEVEPFDGTPDDNGILKDSVYTFNFTDNSIIHDDNDEKNPVAPTVSSKDGVLTVNSNNNLYKFSNQHGASLSTGNTFNIKVAGDAIVKFNLCEESKASSSTITASAPKGEFISPKGEFTGNTTLPLVCGTTDGLSTAIFVYNGPATTLTFTVKKDGGETLYLHDINVSNLPEETYPPVAVGNGKADVWDFGAEQLDSSKYNNMLDVDTINGIYEGKYEPGTSGIAVSSFTIGDFFWIGSGKDTNRIRTTNTAITRWDENKALEIEGTTYTGRLYSNGAYPYFYAGLKLYKNDVLTLYMASNSNPSTIYLESPTGNIQVGQSNAAGVKLTFSAPEYGLYKIYSIDEKVVIHRMIREHTNPVRVTGKIDTSAAANIPADYQLCFTNTTTGVATAADITDGSYTVYLNDSYSYDMSLLGANGYMIKDVAPLEIASGSSDMTKDVTIVEVDIVTVTGKITGLPADVLSKLKLSFANKEKPYIPDFTVSGDSITMYLERGVSYDVVAEGINDYAITNSPISMTADGTKDLVFALKPTYDINVSYDGLPKDAQSTAILTFTNLNEEGYVYTFNPGETPKLRDGSYSVQVTGTGSAAFAQKLTSNVNVNGKAVDKTISFKPLEAWDFSLYNTTNYSYPGIETIGDKTYYLGLELTGNVQENKTYLLAGNGGEINIPVKAGNFVTITYCYSAEFEINGKSYTTENSTGSTGKTDVIRIVADKDGFVTIKANNTTYFNSIEVADPSVYEYKSVVTVGADKDYQTINDALAAVAKMDRPNSERVNIVIDPGNYEEMLLVKVPNVTLSNAAGDKSALTLLNKGVDIGNNVVRITSYYGTGYDYFSMDSDYTSNDEILAVNKENGYLSTKNPGSGTTTYWNATVVVFADGFEADGIVFENSFNQYISKKEAEDTVVMWTSGGKGIRPTTYGDTSVQNRSFVERAGALSIVGGVKEVVFNKCKFVSRQDTLFGGDYAEVVFQKCDIYGGVDYIYGGMTAVFYQCNLVMNNDESTASDQSYLTAAQQPGGRGYLMYNCTVTSTTPGVDTANEHYSKPGFFGRPWKPNTSEVVFYYTVIEDTNYPDANGQSLIVPAAWNDGLGGQSPGMYEYGTIELSGEDNSAARVGWTTMLDEPKLLDGTEISIKAFLGDWADELNERGLVIELTPDEMNKEAVRDNRNPDTGLPAGIGVAITVIAIASSAIVVAKKKK